MVQMIHQMQLYEYAYDYANELGSKPFDDLMAT